MTEDRLSGWEDASTEFPNDFHRTSRSRMQIELATSIAHGTFEEAESPGATWISVAEVEKFVRATAALQHGICRVAAICSVLATREIPWRNAAVAPAGFSISATPVTEDSLLCPSDCSIAADPSEANFRM